MVSYLDIWFRFLPRVSPLLCYLVGVRVYVHVGLLTYIYACLFLLFLGTRFRVESVLRVITRFLSFIERRRMGYACLYVCSVLGSGSMVGYRFVVRYTD